MSDTKTVVAIQKGFYGGQLREEGAVFAVPAGETANWWKDAPNAVQPTSGHDGTSNDDSLHVDGGNKPYVDTGAGTDTGSTGTGSEQGAGGESPFAHFTKEQIAAELTKRGIEFNERDKKEVLLGILVNSGE